MIKKKIYLIILVLTLYFSCVFQGINTIFNQQDEKINRNIKIKSSSASISHEYEWHRTWGGNFGDAARSVVVDSMGDVYITGYTDNYGGGVDDDIALVKYDSSGVKKWNRTWGGNDFESCRSMVLDSLDNVYFAGFIEYSGTGARDIVLVKYNSSGVQQWNRTWDGNYDDRGWGVAVDSSDNIYVAGDTVILTQSKDILLVKYDNSGVLQWNRTWGGINGDYARSIAVDSSDNIYIGGTTYSFGSGGYDMVLVKYDNSGVLQWNITWGENYDDIGWDVAVDLSDNVYITGTAILGVEGGVLALVKYDSSGIQQWNQTYICTPDYDRSEGVVVDSLFNVYLAGRFDGFPILLKYNRYGEQEWIIQFTLMGVGQAHGIALDSFDNVYLAGSLSLGSFGNISDMFLVKYRKIPEIIINSPHQNELFGSVAPTFNISILEPNLESAWYTLDDGITNITISGLTGTISQAEWDKKGNDWITIRFWANNTLSKEGNADVIVFKDTDNPEITISSPSQGDRIGDIAPNYSISIIEPNLDSIWYTIDGGITNYTITQLSSIIDQSAWDIASYGNIAIKFYANDLLGNTGNKEVVIQKVEELNGGPAIFGYNVLIIISLTGLITAIILKRKFN